MCEFVSGLPTTGWGNASAGSIPAASTFDNERQAEKNDDNSIQAKGLGSQEAKQPKCQQMTQTDSLRHRVTPRALPNDAEVDRLLAAWTMLPEQLRTATLAQLEQIAAAVPERDERDVTSGRDL